MSSRCLTRARRVLPCAEIMSFLPDLTMGTCGGGETDQEGGRERQALSRQTAGGREQRASAREIKARMVSFPDRYSVLGTRAPIEC